MKSRKSRTGKGTAGLSQTGSATANEKQQTRGSKKGTKSASTAGLPKTGKKDVGRKGGKVGDGLH